MGWQWEAQYGEPRGGTWYWYWSQYHQPPSEVPGGQFGGLGVTGIPGVLGMGRGTRDLGAQENKPSEGVIKTISRRHYYHAPKKYHMYANKRAGNLGLQAPGGVLGQGDEACIPHRLGTGTFMSGQESQLCNIMLQGCVSGHTLYISSARSHRPAGHNNTPVRGSSPSAPLSPCPPI